MNKLITQTNIQVDLQSGRGGRVTEIVQGRTPEIGRVVYLSVRDDQGSIFENLKNVFPKNLVELKQFFFLTEYRSWAFDKRPPSLCQTKVGGG